MIGEALFVDHSPETIAKLRRLQVGFFLLHFVLIIVGATQFTAEGDQLFELIAVLAIPLALWELFGNNSLLRASVDELQVWSIDYRPLRWYEWLVIAPVGVLTVSQLLVVTFLDPSELTFVIAMLPILLTALFLPAILIFFTSIFSAMTIAANVALRRPPPESEFWDDLRSKEPEPKKITLVAVLFWSCLDLQLLLLTIWSGSMGFLLLWGILTTGLLKEVPLTHKPKPISFPGMPIGR